LPPPTGSPVPPPTFAPLDPGRFARWLAPRKMALLVPGPRRNHPLPWAIALVTLTSLTAGAVVGLVAGTVAGTFVIPIIGTINGGFVGIWIGLLAGVIVTPVLVGVLVARHRSVVGPHTPLPDVVRFAAVLTTLLVVIGVGVAMSFVDDHMLVVLWALVVVCVTATSLVLTLRLAARAISTAWCRPFGWTRDGTRTMVFTAGP
jgi:hypothetical protein